MNQNTSLEDRLEALGAAIRERPRLTDRVMDEVRESGADGPTEEPPTPLTRAKQRRWKILAASVISVATVAGGVLIALLIVPSPSVGWADVTKAIQSQKWIRGTAAFPDDRDGTMWLSPERQIWAFRSKRSFRFFDGRERAKYEYYGGSRAIERLPLGEEDARRVLPLDALSQDKDAIGPWLFGTEKIVDQKRREVTEDGKTWIEFQMVLWRGDANQATLRVDPETKLPVYLLVSAPGDASKSFKWQFDYPEDGPTDIYALGVPREIKIDDQMPSDEVQRVLDAMAASRALIGDFRLLVAEEEDNRVFIVMRKGDRWRVDVCTGFYPPKPADGGAASDWFAERLKRSEPIPQYICDGKTVYKNPKVRPISSDGDSIQWERSRHAPQDLLSTGGSFDRSLSCAPYVTLATFVYPDLTPIRGWGFEFDPQPADSPGCVLIKRSARTTRKEPWRAHEWFYLDPAKGHAVIRAELFGLPADAPADPEVAGGQTIRMESFQQSPQGFWYPTVAHDTRSTVGELNDKGEILQRKTAPQTTTVRYDFDFEVNLPDSLFTIDDAQLPNSASAGDDGSL